jgi:Glycosyl transferases group 1
MKWICAQIGAREHYAIPRVLNSLGKLETLYTDFWATRLWRILGKLTSLRRIATRYHIDLSSAHVNSFNLETTVTFLRRKKSLNIYDEYVRFGKAFGSRIVHELERTENNTNKPINSIFGGPKPFIFFGYDTGFLEPAQWVKSRGGKTIVCQTDPSRFDEEMLREEESKWPSWSQQSVEVSDDYYIRREKEWAVADLVIVNSEWSKRALIKQGVNERKIIVVPLAYVIDEAKQGSGGSELITKFEHPHSGFTQIKPLRVLFLGRVMLRKGIQYLIEAAKLLKNESVYFDIVGPISISEAALKSIPPNMSFYGPVTRDQTQEFYARADLFVLPTLSDGFAITQLEAMAQGLPVIATPNCGEVVTHDVDGLIVPACDPKALAEAFRLIIQDPERLRLMSEAAKCKVKQFSLSKLGENLKNLEKILMSK